MFCFWLSSFSKKLQSICTLQSKAQAEKRARNKRGFKNLSTTVPDGKPPAPAIVHPMNELAFDLYAGVILVSTRNYQLPRPSLTCLLLLLASAAAAPNRDANSALNAFIVISHVTLLENAAHKLPRSDALRFWLPASGCGYIITPWPCVRGPRQFVIFRINHSGSLLRSGDNLAVNA